ncbi:MAG: outer membrane lipoprotein-sorting protein [Nitrospirae bacterium]|nr:outer membrane lipoprotein-sorting protein [Nitrospirota bacterium]
MFRGRFLILSIVLFTAVIAVETLAGSPGDEPAPKAADIVAASDKVRNPDRPFSLKTVLTEYDKGRQQDGMTLIVYSKKTKDTGTFRSLVKFVEPKRDKGKLMLKDGNILWFYDPDSRASVRISPEQRLMGQAANGDVVTVDFHNDYKASLIAQESIMDADKKESTCYKLSLTASNDTVTYHKITFWVRKDNYRPVKGKFYSESDSLLKTAYYRGYEEQLGAARPTEVIIIDGLNPQLVTTMKFSDYAYREIPDMWFQKDFLPRFTAGAGSNASY